MIRIITNTIVSLILLISTTGFTVSKHYCGNRLVSVTINHEPEPCCGTDSDCCKSETDYYQLNTDIDIPKSLSVVAIDHNTFLFEHPDYNLLLQIIEPGIISSLFSNILSPPGVQNILPKIQSFLL